MSIVHAGAVRESSPPSVSPPPREPSTTSTPEARWNAWLERGRQNDLKVRRRVRILLLVAGVIGLLVALFTAAGAR